MKRILTAALWFYSFWYLGSMIAAFLNVADLIGPALGCAAGVIVWADPRHVIWNRRRSISKAATAA